MAKKTIKIEKWEDKLQPAPKESYSDWISIEHALSEYTVPVVAEAIDKGNVQAIDRLGRRILATDGGENDIYSKAFIKKHLASRNPINASGEGESISEEYCDVENNPLETFGWPKDCLPDLKNINPHVTTNPNHQPQKNIVRWTQRPFEEFEEEYRQAGSYEAAGKKHGVSRQRYSEEYKKKEKAHRFGRP